MFVDGEGGIDEQPLMRRRLSSEAQCYAREDGGRDYLLSQDETHRGAAVRFKGSVIRQGGACLWYLQRAFRVMASFATRYLEM